MAPPSSRGLFGRSSFKIGGANSFHSFPTVPVWGLLGRRFSCGSIGHLVDHYPSMSWHPSSGQGVALFVELCHQYDDLGRRILAAAGDIRQYCRHGRLGARKDGEILPALWHRDSEVDPSHDRENFGAERILPFSDAEANPILSWP